MTFDDETDLLAVAPSSDGNTKRMVGSRRLAYDDNGKIKIKEKIFKIISEKEIEIDLSDDEGSDNLLDLSRSSDEQDRMPHADFKAHKSILKKCKKAVKLNRSPGHSFGPLQKKLEEIRNE